MELNEYQRRAATTDQRPGGGAPALLFPIVGLASEVGSLTRHVKKWLRDGDAYELFASESGDELGDILWYSANVATKLGLELEDIAAANLDKTRGRWPTKGGSPARFNDSDFPPHEQLPRDASVRFEESVAEDGKIQVRIYHDDVQLADRLTDNAYEDDGYRYHDAFHLAYAALLGWSPLTRKFFGRRRESVPRVREVEDGGRAIVLEEAIAAFAFDYARDVRFLEGVKHVDFSLLTAIRRLTAGLEVRDRTAAEWEHAILRSFEVWRPLWENRGGWLHMDLRSRRIRYEPFLATGSGNSGVDPGAM